MLAAASGRSAMAAEGRFPMKLHRGINISSIAGNGLEGLLGLLIAIAFVFIFTGVFLPRKTGSWLVVLFLCVEIGAAILYILINRRSRRESERLMQQMHQINEEGARRHE
jgi:uncharacterized membrane protein